jgi:hypothetical protein
MATEGYIYQGKLQVAVWPPPFDRLEYLGKHKCVGSSREHRQHRQTTFIRVQVLRMACDDPTVTLIAIIGIENPFRHGLHTAAMNCHNAGVTVKMYTGNSDDSTHPFPCHQFDADEEI